MVSILPQSRVRWTIRNEGFIEFCVDCPFHPPIHLPPPYLMLNVFSIKGYSFLNYRTSPNKQCFKDRGVLVKYCTKEILCSTGCSQTSSLHTKQMLGCQRGLSLICWKSLYS